MRFSVLQENLQRALKIVGHAVSKKPSVPILTHVLVTARDGRVELQTTDFEVSITVPVGARIDQEGSLTVPYKPLVDAISHWPKERIDFAQQEPSLVASVVCGERTATLIGMNAEEYPLILPVERAGCFDLPAPAFKEALEKALTAIAKDDTRPVLTGVHFASDGTALVLEACDGYRLVKVQIPVSIGEPFNTVLPGKGAATLAKLLAKATRLHVRLEPDYAAFVTDDFSLRTRLEDGVYPAVDTVIDSVPFGTTVTFVTGDLLEAAKGALQCTKGTTNAVALTIRPGIGAAPGQLQLTAHGETVSNAIAVTLPAAVQGAEQCIHIEPRFLVDFLKLLPEQAQISVPAPDRPILYRQGELTTLVMPRAK